jgi:hypothetical protein
MRQVSERRNFSFGYNFIAALMDHKRIFLVHRVSKRTDFAFHIFLMSTEIFHEVCLGLLAHLYFQIDSPSLSSRFLSSLKLRLGE